MNNNQFGINIKFAEPKVFPKFPAIVGKLGVEVQANKCSLNIHPIPVLVGKFGKKMLKRVVERIFFHSDGIVYVCLFNSDGKAPLYLKNTPDGVYREEPDL